MLRNEGRMKDRKKKEERRNEKEKERNKLKRMRERKRKNIIQQYFPIHISPNISFQECEVQLPIQQKFRITRLWENRKRHRQKKKKIERERDNERERKKEEWTV